MEYVLLWISCLTQNDLILNHQFLFCSPNYWKTQWIVNGHYESNCEIGIEFLHQPIVLIDLKLEDSQFIVIFSINFDISNLFSNLKQVRWTSGIYIAESRSFSPLLHSIVCPRYFCRTLFKLFHIYIYLLIQTMFIQ